MNVPDDYVAMGQHICRVCGHAFDSGEILLHRNLRSIPKNARVTGWGLCPEHQKLYDDGYIALIEAKNPPNGTTMHLEDANRTGRLVHIRREVAIDIFNIDIPEKLELMFIEPGVIEKLEEMMKPEA